MRVALEVARIDPKRLKACSSFLVEYETRLRHAQRLEERGLEVLGESLAGEDFDQTAENGLVDSVEVLGSGVELKRVLRRDFTECLEVLMTCLQCVWFVGQRGQPVPGVIAEAGSVRHQIDDPERRLRGTECVAVLHRQLGEAGDVLRDGVVPLEEPLFMKGQHGDDGDRFRHRPDREERLLRDVSIACSGRIPNGAMDLLSVLPDQHDVASRDFVLDQALLDPDEFFGHLWIEIARRSRCSDEKDADRQEVSGHGSSLCCLFECVWNSLMLTVPMWTSPSQCRDSSSRAFGPSCTGSVRSPHSPKVAALLRNPVRCCLDSVGSRRYRPGTGRA